ncbi:MAG: DUF5357 family protein [Microcoleaceae cyanobacterium]
MKNPIITNLDKFWKTCLKPPHFFHWKTLLIITLGFGIAAVLTINSIEWQQTFITWGYLSFIATLSVFFKEKPLKIKRFSLHPWLLASLISLFFYANFLGENLTEFAMIGFPLFSVCIASIYEMLESGVKWEISIPLIRANFIIFLLVHCLISCWIRFNILMEHWLKDYPSVFAEDFHKKALVIKIKSSSINDSRGIVIIKNVENYLTLKSEKKPWNEVEKWLFNIAQNRLNLRSEAWKTLGKLPEDSLWKFTYNMQQSQSDYRLQLFAQWYGPGSRTYGYYVTKTCHILRNRDRASIECSPVKAKDETEPRQTK